MSVSSVPGGVAPAGQAAQPDGRRWFVLAIVGIAQLMIVLDITIMNIALPSAQRALHFSNVDRQWVITAYALAFGSLLLFGGRLGDLFGRKVTLLTGLIGFAVASAEGGASADFTMLITARACQGMFAALLAPAALGVLTTTFSDPRERGRAFGVYGAIAGAGGLVRLPRTIPPKVATEMILTGRRITAAEALAYGLVNRVTEAGQALDGARALAAEILAGSPTSVRISLQVMAETRGIPDVIDAVTHPSAAFDDLMASEDMIEGLTAFAQKRPPRWRNR